MATPPTPDEGLVGAEVLATRVAACGGVGNASTKATFSVRTCQIPDKHETFLAVTEERTVSLDGSTTQNQRVPPGGQAELMVTTTRVLQWLVLVSTSTGLVEANASPGAGLLVVVVDGTGAVAPWATPERIARDTARHTATPTTHRARRRAALG